MVHSFYRHYLSQVWMLTYRIMRRDKCAFYYLAWNWSCFILRQMLYDTSRRQLLRDQYPRLIESWTSTLDQTLYLTLNLTWNPIAFITLTLYLWQNKARSNCCWRIMSEHHDRHRALQSTISFKQYFVSGVMLLALLRFEILQTRLELVHHKREVH